MKISSEYLNKHRLIEGQYGSDSSYGMTGAFMIPAPNGKDLRIISSSGIWGGDWEHISVSVKNRYPNWEEMCLAKDLFWDEDETVIQYHPAKENYVDQHPYCLHLWKPKKEKIPLPPSIYVGIKKPIMGENKMSDLIPN